MQHFNQSVALWPVGEKADHGMAVNGHAALAVCVVHRWCQQPDRAMDSTTVIHERSHLFWVFGQPGKFFGNAANSLRTERFSPWPPQAKPKAMFGDEWPYAYRRLRHKP